MERLTKVMSCPDGTKIYDISNKLFGLNTSRADKTRIILEKLAEYEDLEEQGRLIKLPCKVGDTVYVVDNCIQIKPAECRIGLIGYTATLEDKGFNFVAEFEKDSSIIEEFEDKNIGKTVFLTKSKAEAKLKELRGGENGKERD